MYKRLNIQIVTALAKLTRLKEEGLLLAVYPDFILAVRPGMNEAERDTAADALLTAAEGLSLPVMEEPIDKDGDENEDNLVIHPDMLEEAGFRDVKTWGELKMRPPKPGEQRISFTARKDK